MHQHPQRAIDRARRLLAERLWSAVEASRAPLTVTARHLPGEPEPFARAIAGTFTPFPVGAPWGPAWTTSWFRLRAAIPAGWPRGDLAVALDLGFGEGPGFECEGLVYRADGSIIKGIHPRSQYVLLDDGAADVDLYVEAAANPNVAAEAFRPTPLGDGIAAGDQPLYRFARADLVALDRDIEQLAVDFDVLIGWAGQLAADEPRRAKILRALSLACDAVDLDDIGGSASAARKELAAALAAPASASTHRVAAVGHAHIDSAWLWPMRETVRKCTRTFANVLALAERYPELRFACSQAQQYAWIEQHQPALFARIKDAVAAGRFVPAGGMWVESDTNMPGGEALVRQFVYGKRYFLDRFGVEPRDVWLPDSFGYTAALPQIARLAGFRWFITQKLAWHPTNHFPHHTFWWEGIDGSRLFAHMPPVDTYNSDLSAADLHHATTNFAEHAGASISLVPFGYGDGGGGPTSLMMERARRQADLEGSPTVEHLTPSEFFERAEREYPDAPTWVGELYLEAHRGTYTSQAEMKRGNRRSEHLLREAELWWATAAIGHGAAYPHDTLDRIWQTVLLHQFHDVLPGSSIAWVHREARAAYRQVIEELESLVGQALAVLAGNGSVPVRFNAAPVASDGVPALGAATATAPRTAARVKVERDGDQVIVDNDVLRVTVAADGTIASVVDARHSRELVPAGKRLNDLVLHQDLPVHSDAWDIDAFYRGTAAPIRSVDELAVDDAGGSATVRVHRSFGASTATQTITLRAGAAQLDFGIDVDWHERDKLLKVAFPLDVRAETSASEVQFGYVRRPTHQNTTWDEAKFEMCAHRWVHVGEPRFGIALANDRSYGHDVTRLDNAEDGRAGTEVRLSLLRAPRYPDPDTDQGRHQASYTLVCGAGLQDAVAAGLRLNLPVRELRGAAAPPPLLRVTGDGITVEAVKLADDRSGDLIVRLYEAHGDRARGRLTWCFQARSAEIVDLLERPLAPCSIDSNGVDLELRPFEIRTIRIHREVGEPA